MTINRKKLEIGVLILGVLTIAAAALLTFVSNNPGRFFLTNITFSFGFLIYIVYSIINTSTLNKLNTNLRADLDEKTTTLEKREKELNQKQQQITSLSEENATLKKANQDLKTDLEQKQQEISKLKES